MIENVTEWKEQEAQLLQIEKKLEEISKSKGQIDLAEVHSLRDNARVIAKDLKAFVDKEFAN
jgi:ribosomal protein S3